MRSLAILFAALLIAPLGARAQHVHDEDRSIEFPDVPGFVTLIGDFHIHTVFSDGSVWPNIRVEEALRDGLDAIAMTDHLEYQPHKDDIPHPDRNRSFAIASEEARAEDLIVIRGSEITRDMPPGHANAIFIQDANRLLQDDALAVFREAKAQGAFTFWNHPNWTAHLKDGVARLSDMHRQLLDEGLLHGIEVVNDVTYSDEALQIALDEGLTILGTSDIHGLVDWQFEVPEGGHRPVTLVFAEERSAESLKEALFEGRTAVWFDDTLIGKEEWIMPLVRASLLVPPASYDDDTSVLLVTVENESDAPFVLANRSEFTLHGSADVLTLAPHQATTLEVKTLDRKERVTLVFEVLNAVTAPKTHPRVVFDVEVE